MALAEVQTALARLLTDKEARAAFARDPQAMARALGLDEPEAQTLAGLAPPAIERFARSVEAKRALDARKLLPLTALALGNAFGPRLRAALPRPPRGAAEDALALVAALVSPSDASPPWIGDLARYEGAFLEIGRRRFGLLIRRFRYDVLAIAAALRRGEAVAGAARRTRLGLWARRPDGTLWHRCLDFV